jgi:mono/diheme cytochrome c family protein
VTARTRRFARLLALIGLLAAVVAAGFWWLTEPERVDAATLPDHTPDLANGERMYWAGGCASCHAAPGATGDAKRAPVGGMALETAFGTFRVPNITPDPKTGIGGWSTADFVTAMTRGVAPDGSHLYPSFPYTSYQRMRTTDLIDLKAFLDSLPPVENAVPPTALAFPYSIRRGIGLWKLLYLDGRPYEPDPAYAAAAERGGYLVEGPGHCGECHTPRDMLGGMRADRFLAGGPAPDGKGTVPNITPDPSGFGKWSEADIAEALASGFTPDFDTLGGAMGSVVANTAHLSAQDRADIAAYLKAIPPLPKE